MCGIVGYIGRRNSQEILLEGLKKLEYRGYDSAGVAVYTSNGLEIKKAKGRLANLESKLQEVPLNGTAGIGHTRWATHGKPSDVNSHPHTDNSMKFSVVHNGIIENYITLKEELIAKGHEFVSETDTEVISHLIADVYRQFKKPLLV
jgi:glutamine---fructose-6-phosphate transaminase (isomerizing)